MGFRETRKKISLPKNPTVATLLDYYITDELLHTTVVNTNVYIASKMIAMNDITKSELCIFLACLFYTGLVTMCCHNGVHVSQARRGCFEGTEAPKGECNKQETCEQGLGEPLLNNNSNS